jgi:hypothetical protein
MELGEPTPEERELSRQLGELTALEAALAKLERELRVFEVQYLSVVGKQYAALDAIEAEIAELEAQREPENAELVERAEAARARAQESAEALGAARPPLEDLAGPPSESLKQLFRRVARLIHPDLAEDEAAREKREQLMAAANRAYVTGDEMGLASILQEWEESPEAVTGQGAAAELLRAVRRIAHVRDRIERADEQIASLRASDLNRLRLRVEAAEAAGRDLLRDMADAIEPRAAAAGAGLKRLRATVTEQ